MYCDSVFENIENVQIEDLTWDQLTWEYPMPMFLFCFPLLVWHILSIHLYDINYNALHTAQRQSINRFWAMNVEKWISENFSLDSSA